MIRLVFGSAAVVALFAVAARLAGTTAGTLLGCALALIGLVVVLLDGRTTR